MRRRERRWSARVSPARGADGHDDAVDFWRGRSVDFFLRIPVVNHAYIRFGDMSTIQGALGIGGR